MSKKFSKEPLRGMKDFYPEDLREVNWILSIVEEIAELYCYEEFEGPLLEPIEIFAAKSSEELVNEQSFIVEKKKGERLILRPELTPSLARMIARKSQVIKKPIRWYSNPTCYRYERPQKGRRRSFKQVNFDIIGENSLYAEIEIFKIIIDLLTSFGATSEQFQIYYNNRRFIDAVCNLILDIPKDKIPLIYKILDKADKMEESEFEKWLIDSFESEFIIQGILKLKDAKELKDFLKDFEDIPENFFKSDGYNELIELEKLIDQTHIKEYCTFAPNVVRGLDYYTGTVFEVFDTGTENTRAIFGGGRYDDLLSLFSDEQLSGIGFGMGVLMLTLFLKTYNLIPEYIYKKDYTDTIYIACINKNVAAYAIELANIIREEYIPCIIDYKFKNLKSQLSKANELGVLITLIIGQKEVQERKITIRNMYTEEQNVINFEDLIENIYQILDKFDEEKEEK
ncbi:MAG: histidine--tRNA ligase [Promethearchaeota archaeon]